MINKFRSKGIFGAARNIRSDVICKSSISTHRSLPSITTVPRIRYDWQSHNIYESPSLLAALESGWRTFHDEGEAIRTLSLDWI